MSLGKYEAFNAVVECGSLTLAGEKLGQTQSAVSHAIASLEREMGFALMIRGRSGTALTANGTRVFRLVRELLQWNERIRQEVAAINGLEVGTVRIGTFTTVSTLWLPSIIQEFNASHSGIAVTLLEGNYDEIAQWTAAGTIDFGFLSLPTDPALDVVPLHRDRMLCVLPDDHPLAGCQVIEYHELSSAPFIMPKGGSDNDVRHILAAHHLNPLVKYELDDDYAIAAWVRKGLGVAILPEMILENIRHPMTAVPLAGNPYRTIAIAARSMTEASPAAQTLMRSVKAWVTRFGRHS